MFKKRAKRADSQVDWAMSLGIFLLYIAWFFVFIKPQFVEKTNMQSAVQNLENSFIEDIIWRIDKVPILIDSNIINEKEPLIVDFPYDWEAENLYLYRRFILDNHKLIFLYNLNNTKDILWLIHSDYVYNQPSFSSDLTITETQASNPQITVNFQNSLITSVDYGSTSINYFNIYVDNIALNTNIYNYSNEGIAASYKVYSTANNTHYVFSNNKRIYSIINNPSNTELYFNLNGYSDYYVNNDNKGSIDYNSTSCTNIISNAIDFYGPKAIAFIFDKEHQLSFCPSNGTLDFNVKLNSGENIYKIILHDEVDEFLNYTDSYSAHIGFPIKFEGLSSIKINQTFLTNYSEKKSEWMAERDFNIRINFLNSTSEFGKQSPTTADVFASELKSYIVDEYGNKENVTINTKIW